MNHAIDPATVELNRSGPQYAIANDRALFHKPSFNEALTLKHSYSQIYVPTEQPCYLEAFAPSAPSAMRSLAQEI
jgi:hypothetical protein